jgi:acyl-coenzyme A synthetase/AMP-(fatty) acid ligase
MRPARVTNSSRSSNIKRLLIDQRDCSRQRAVLFVETLPRTANGKLMRSGLKLP